ncbi:MAG: hypothetical protein ABI076_00115 [Acidobacteriaceae bacterium]
MVGVGQEFGLGIDTIQVYNCLRTKDTQRLLLDFFDSLQNLQEGICVDDSRMRKGAPTGEPARIKGSFWTRSKPIVDLFSGIAVIFTLLFIALQWREMRRGSRDTHDLAVAAGDQAKISARQLKEMGKALQRQDALIKEVTSQAKSANSLAGSSKRSANAAWEAIKEAEEEDRPWLGFVKFVPSTPAAGQELHLDANLQNSGKSPAQMLSTATWIGPHVGEIYAFSELELPMLASQVIPSRAVLVPGQGFQPSGGDTTLNIKDWEKIQSGVTNLYAIGFSRYRGINEPKSTDHHTSMCEVWLVKKRKWTLCGFLNDAD